MYVLLFYEIELYTHKCAVLQLMCDYMGVYSCMRVLEKDSFPRRCFEFCLFFLAGSITTGAAC